MSNKRTVTNCFSNVLFLKFKMQFNAQTDGEKLTSVVESLSSMKEEMSTVKAEISSMKEAIAARGPSNATEISSMKEDLKQIIKLLRKRK